LVGFRPSSRAELHPNRFRSSQISIASNPPVLGPYKTLRQICSSRQTARIDRMLFLTPLPGPGRRAGQSEECRSWWGTRGWWSQAEGHSRSITRSHICVASERRAPWGRRATSALAWVKTHERRTRASATVSGDKCYGENVFFNPRARARAEKKARVFLRNTCSEISEKFRTVTFRTVPRRISMRLRAEQV